MLTQTQRMARMYGPENSLTIPQQGPALAAYRKLAEDAGMDPARARRFLDDFLALTGKEP